MVLNVAAVAKQISISFLLFFTVAPLNTFVLKAASLNFLKLIKAAESAAEINPLRLGGTFNKKLPPLPTFFKYKSNNCLSVFTVLSSSS